MNKLRLLSVMVVLSLVLAACGAAPTATPVTAPTSAPPAATATTAPTMIPTTAPTMVPTTAPTVAPTTAPTSTVITTAYTVMASTNAQYGAILVDGKGMTLYTFAIDKPNESMCTDGCATAWPPLTVPAGTTPTAGPGVSGTLGTFQRADGTTQVTYDQLPLYTFIRDKNPGDAFGQGVNAQGGLWWVVPTDIGAGAPDFTQYGFPTVLATETITPGQAITMTADVYTVSILNGAFDIPVSFELLSGDPSSFKAPSGETPVFAFAFRVEDPRTSTLIGKFYKPVMLTITSSQIVTGAKYYNVATDGTLTENPTGLTVAAGQLSHPVAGAPVGWLITVPASAPTTTLRTPEQAALAAAGGKQIGGSVTVLAEWTGSEQDAFTAMITPFQNATGIRVDYTGTRDLPAVLTTRVQGGNPPDLSVMPTPGQMRVYASQGKLVDLSSLLTMSDINKWYTSGWLDLGTADNKLVAVFVKSAIKGLIWYDPKVWTGNNYQFPATWDDMMTLSQNVASSGTTPWCVALESGAATGWPGTDWLEDIVLRQSGVDVYNAWWQGTQKWTSAEIKQAWQTWGEIVATQGMVYGGPNAMLTTNFGNVGNGLFTTPPNCVMAHQAIFITSFFQSNNPGVQPVTDFDFFPFPPFQAGQPVNAEIAGDEMAMFNQTPQSVALMNYLATPEAQDIWAKIGGGYLSANSAVPVSDYPDPLSQKAAQRMASAVVTVFDASDNMPNAMQSAFYTAILNYIQAPNTLDSILQNLDSVQATAYSQ
jgi:alpha-glucoside transport system substrate-binding protein